MTGEAHCGSVSALTLGLPRSCAIPEAKGTLPKGLFARTPLSAKTKQHLAHAIDSITMLALLRPENTGVTLGKRVPEILVMGLRLADGTHDVPADIVELIDAQRKSGIVFVCVRTAEFEGTTREESCFVIRRPMSARAGHAPTFLQFCSDWIPAGEATLEIGGTTTDELWDCLCSQVIFGTADYMDLDVRIVRAGEITVLRAQIAKLEAAHQRAKTQDQRNEAHAKLRKARQQLESLEQMGSND